MLGFVTRCEKKVNCVENKEEEISFGRYFNISFMSLLLS
jgi:hypothetical protein